MSTHNICFRCEIRKLFTWYLPLSGPMGDVLQPLHGTNTSFNKTKVDSKCNGP